MGLLDGVLEWYSELDDIDRQKLVLTGLFVIVILFAIYAVGNAFSAADEVFGEGVDAVDNSVSNLANVTDKFGSEQNDSAITYY